MKWRRERNKCSSWASDIAEIIGTLWRADIDASLAAAAAACQTCGALPAGCSHSVLQTSLNSDGSGFPKQRRARVHLGEKQFTLMPRPPVRRRFRPSSSSVVNSSKESHSCLAHKIMFSVHLLLNTHSALWQRASLVIQRSYSSVWMSSPRQVINKMLSQNEIVTSPQSQISKTFPSIITTCHLNLCLFQISGIRSRGVWRRDVPTSISTSVHDSWFKEFSILRLKGKRHPF